MLKFLTIAAAAACLATPAQATLAHARKAIDDNAYARCLARLIESRGIRYAVDHAGETICDRDARRRLERHV